jgi:hypothetical protein
MKVVTCFRYTLRQKSYSHTIWGTIVPQRRLKILHLIIFLILSILKVNIIIIIIIIIIIHNWGTALILFLFFDNLHHCLISDNTYIAAGKQVVIADVNKIHKI